MITSEQVAIKVWKFPTGEIGVQCEGNWIPYAKLTLKWESNDDLIALAQVVDALREMNRHVSLSLSIPYFPYSRQDRRCNRGEAHSLKVVANFINSLNFSEVITKDPHSYVMEALIDRLTVIPQHHLAHSLPEVDVLVAPDAGASKKIYNLAKIRPSSSVVVAEKVRDSYGDIVKTSVDSSSMEGKSICVVDDICDGGATFLSLADAILANTLPSKLILFVSHGFFTKGVDKLLEVYDNIYVSNLYNTAVADKVKEI